MMTWMGVFIWSGISGLGLQFLYVGSRVRFDKSFAFFGYSLFTLSALFFTAAWGDPGAGPAEFLFRPPFLHLLALGFFVLSPLFLSHLTGIPPSKGYAGLRIWCALLAPVFVFDSVPGHGLLIKGHPPFAVPSAGYAFLFAPCFALFLFLTWRILILHLRSCRGKERGRFLPFVAGWTALTVLGTLQAAGFLGFPAAHFPGPVQPGLIGAGLFAAAGTYELMQRFLSLHRTNGEALAKLGEAYASLQASAELNALGASAASISHEIRNYAATLKGNTQLLRRKAGPAEMGEEIERIRATAERLEIISRDIASYSRSSLATEKRILTLDTVATDCIRLHFQDRRAVFSIGPWPGGGVEGDGGKLSQVFLNLFKNALEAGAMKIDVRFRAFRDRMIVAIEDDGAGCAQEELGRIAIPFFSGKGEGGTGLGCAIAEAILGDHRASFRAYSKNALSGKETGLVVNMVFPLVNTALPLKGEDQAARTSTEITVVSENPALRADLAAPLLHLGIRPAYVAGNGLPGLRRGMLVCVDGAVEENLMSDWGGLPALSVDRFRSAVFRAPEEEGTPAFLYSEENLADLLDRSGL